MLPFVTFLYCKTGLQRSEFLIHAADVEGLCQGIDEELVKSRLGVAHHTSIFNLHCLQN